MTTRPAEAQEPAALGHRPRRAYRAVRVLRRRWASDLAGRRARNGRDGRNERARRPDAGSAMIEFVGLSVVLLIPFVYFFLALFSVQRSAFAVTQAAREAGRAYSTANNEEEGLTRAQLAAQLAFQDQGIDTAPELRFAPQGADCGASDPGDGAETLEPGAVFVVCVRTIAPLPGVSVLGSGLADVTLNGAFTVVIDQYRADRSDAQP